MPRGPASITASITASIAGGGAGTFGDALVPPGIIEDGDGGGVAAITNSQAPSLAPVPSRLRRATLVRAYEHVARDRGGGDHVERIDPGGEGARMHRDADGLIGLVQPAGRKADQAVRIPMHPGALAAG